MGGNMSRLFLQDICGDIRQTDKRHTHLDPSYKENLMHKIMPATLVISNLMFLAFSPPSFVLAYSFKRQLEA